MSELRKKLWLKYLLDKVAALPLVVVSLPLLLAAALAIAFEGLLDRRARRPVFYVEERLSQGRPFRIYKLSLSYPGTQIPGEEGRITPVGGWLKKWYLDELPQLFNILKGDMTLVGPRPNVPWKAAAQIEMGMESKLLLRAGLAGVVQAAKREGGVPDGEYLALEREYMARVREKGPVGIVVMDGAILARTFLTALRGGGL